MGALVTEVHKREGQGVSAAAAATAELVIIVPMKEKKMEMMFSYYYEQPVEHLLTPPTIQLPLVDAYL